jgi:hypothetical protein
MMLTKLEGFGILSFKKIIHKLGLTLLILYLQKF